MILAQPLKFSINEINALANCNLRKSIRFGANSDLNDVFTQPGSIGDFRQPSRHVSCSSDSGHIATAKQKKFTDEYLNSDRVWKWSTT